MASKPSGKNKVSEFNSFVPLAMCIIAYLESIITACFVHCLDLFRDHVKIHLMSDYPSSSLTSADMEQRRKGSVFYQVATHTGICIQAHTHVHPSMSVGGFVPVSAILSHRRGKQYNEEDVRRVVANCPKSRFTLKEDADAGQLLIRANQGHSIQVRVVANYKLC